MRTLYTLGMSQERRTCFATQPNPGTVTNVKRNVPVKSHGSRSTPTSGAMAGTHWTESAVAKEEQKKRAVAARLVTWRSAGAAFSPRRSCPIVAQTF